MTHVSTQEPVAALTFDDGPDPVWTPRLLEILDAYRARATFFMVGQAAHRHSGLLRRVAASGHAIGNHSWDHPSFPSLSARARRAQIRACERALAPHGQRLFRPPYGHQDIWSRLDALLLGYRVVAWSVWAADWRDRSPSTIAARVMDALRPGSVVAFHDGLVDAVDEQYFDRGATLDAVRLLLNRLAGTFSFVTVPELLRHGRPQQVHWVTHGSADVMAGLRRRGDSPAGGTSAAKSTGP